MAPKENAGSLNNAMTTSKSMLFVILMATHLSIFYQIHWSDVEPLNQMFGVRELISVQVFSCQVSLIRYFTLFLI